jgi:hypothetical protein
VGSAAKLTAPTASMAATRVVRTNFISVPFLGFLTNYLQNIQLMYSAIKDKFVKTHKKIVQTCIWVRLSIFLSNTLIFLNL